MSAGFELSDNEGHRATGARAEVDDLHRFAGIENSRDSLRPQSSQRQKAVTHCQIRCLCIAKNLGKPSLVAKLEQVQTPHPGAPPITRFQVESVFFFRLVEDRSADRPAP